MNKKILFVATTGTHINSFHLPYIQWLQEQGYTVDVACKGAGKVHGADWVWEVPFARSPLRRDNIKAYRMLRQIIDREQYRLVHCHTPMGGVIARLAAMHARRAFGTKVVYTAHGFHFYKGAPLRNWLSFFPVEWLLAHFTDALLTINKEDHAALRRFCFPVLHKVATNGVGIDRKRIGAGLQADKDRMRKALGFAPQDLVILYIAEFIPRKNHRILFKAIPKIIRQHPNARFVFAGGKAVTGDAMEAMAKQQGFADQVLFTGFTKNIGQYIAVADIGVSASLSEGLGLGLAELMCQGVPVVLSNIRGHNELVRHGHNGFFFDPHDLQGLADALCHLCADASLRETMGRNAVQFMQQFMLENTLPQTTAVYQQLLYLSATPQHKKVLVPHQTDPVNL